MTKNKLAKFKEMQGFDHVYQPAYNEVLNKDYHLKGKWKESIFNNSNPIVLELGCGKGEYSVGLAERYPEKNFIGVDIKGARLFRGAKTALQKGLKNAAFIRTRVDFIQSFFGKDEISEIWFTFPDPQPKKIRKRLSSSWFLNRYSDFLVDNAIIHLKTDNKLFYEYTKALAEENNFEINCFSDNVYDDQSLPEEVLNIQTFYEKQFLAENKNIHYLEFHLNNILPFKEPEEFNAKFAKP
ncbi:MAG: tRNA (guanosine(46)-N7)-methyltransferase TrmB [Bacteroidota bacterium]